MSQILSTSKTYSPTSSLNIALEVQVITIYAGAGAPTFTATKGSIYSRNDGSSTSTRLYVNTDGATTWTNVVTAA